MVCGASRTPIVTHTHLFCVVSLFSVVPFCPVFRCPLSWGRGPMGTAGARDRRLQTSSCVWRTLGSAAQPKPNILLFFGVAFLGRGYRNPPCLSSCFEGYGALQHPMSLVVVHSFRHLQWELGVAPLMPPLSPPKEMRDGAEAYYIGDNTKQQTYRTCIVTVGGPNTHHKPSLTKVCFDVIPVRIHVELKLGLIQPCTLVYGL